MPFAWLLGVGVGVDVLEESASRVVCKWVLRVWIAELEFEKSHIEWKGVMESGLFLDCIKAVVEWQRLEPIFSKTDEWKNSGILRVTLKYLSKNHTINSNEWHRPFPSGQRNHNTFFRLFFFGSVVRYWIEFGMLKPRYVCSFGRSFFFGRPVQHPVYLRLRLSCFN